MYLNYLLLFLSFCLFSDVDECALNHECTQICNNVIAGYSCACFAGYDIADDRRSCDLGKTHIYAKTNTQTFRYKTSDSSFKMLFIF